MQNVLLYLLYGAHALISILLIILVISQTSKHEGLGVAGGGSAPAPRGRAGMDEQLSTYTRYAAIAFMSLSALLYFVSLKVGAN